MKSLFTIISLWRPHLGRLLLGVLVSSFSLWASLLLMGQSGSRLTGAILGFGASFYLLRLAGLSRIILRYGERYITHDALFRALADLRVWFFRRLARTSAMGIGQKRSGDLLSKLVADIQSLDNLYIRVFVPLIVAFFSVPLLFILCAKGSIQLAFIITALFCLLVFVVPFITGILSYKMGPLLLEARSLLYSQILDLASGLREVHLFGAEERLKSAIEKKEHKLYQLQKRENMHMALCNGLASLISRLGVLVVLGYAGGLYFHHPDMLHNFMLFFVVITLFDQFVDLPRAGFLAGQIFHAAHRVTEPAMSKNLIEDHDGQTAPSSYELVARDLSFGWDDLHILYENVHFSLKEGERVALMGPSGSGKSSLVALIMGIVKPKKGEILFGGVSLSSIKTESLRHKIGWLSQASHLFSDTIRNNLLLGQKNVPDKALWDALEKAQIADFVRSLPEGLDSWIGENGSTLSGGQGRRIALARVLLKQTPIIILDEPTEGLDRDTQKEFIKTLNHLDPKISVLLITHSLTGAEKLDRVIMLENKKLTNRLV
ncbi:thiol reductant ABC exporter subunit CydC [Aristophania vespae]|uniref:Thiol reductant ABC exporter subunit CydC n=1 Tax=Aristophania vespae TaxID=2697033 RepID=A0A6P1NKZ4_9PROT|nr:thiol reductant ABC exporter subunit CydC [Aristophania vespae]QHI95541.1 thiol reductant ABC exporter subunit CydC [Aristophania vespae]